MWAFFVVLLVPGLFSVMLLPITGKRNIGGQEFLGYLQWYASYSAIFIVLLIVILYVWAEFSYRNYLYELADDAFRKELGVIYKKYVSIPYDRIQNVDIYRGIWARILGLSDLHIQTAGMGTIGKFGALAEGRLPGLAMEEAEKLRDELIRRTRQSKGQGV